MAEIDLNADLGESTADRVVGHDASMLAIVTSANVSCGYHAGSPEGIRATLGAAVAHGVVIGAHPAYRDYDGFGRRARDMPTAALQAEVEYQLGALAGLASAVGGQVSYVKPHGALYNTIARDRRQARAVVAAIKAVHPHLTMLGLAGGVALTVAREAGLAVAAEAFADRAYQPDGHLVSRNLPGAVLHDPAEIAERMLRLAEEGVIRAIDGTDVRIAAQSICVHGDSPGAVATATEIRRRLEASGVRLAPFVARN